MWCFIDDENYHGYFLHVYGEEEGKDFAIRVYESAYLEWDDAIYIDDCKALDAAFIIGRAFVMGILTEREGKFFGKGDKQ